MTNEQYFALLETGRKICEEAENLGNCSSVIPFRNGVALEAIEPGCFLYVACGEDEIVYINDAMRPTSPAHVDL